ncbi:hypothetical protein L1D31_21770 [Vibrio sp. Isolate23]|uniref:hypothetical protein n=1 Tax=Vibrio sp. Isolate23 TaxID=2908533 RepID=UPI001EFE3EBC|nr:hypothetical protein [Vibrio sp. Isolate23]MCG9685154.1 hypothetical protein [Vibrio sp. Isolate23]
MVKIIELTPVGKAVSYQIHHRRILATKGDNYLIDKELDRYKSIREVVIEDQKAGDPGTQNHYHGCEARGV